MMKATTHAGSTVTPCPKPTTNETETMRVLVNVEGLAEEGFVTLSAIAKSAAAYIAPFQGLESLKALLRLIDDTADRYADCIDAETERLRKGRSSIGEVH